MKLKLKQKKMNSILKINTRGLLSNLLLKKNFSNTAALNSNIFNVQDEQDFNNRVVNSKKPVIVDFHAV